MENIPERIGVFDSVWQAFTELHGHRREASPLAITDIVAWLDLYGVDDKRFYFRVISALDLVWLEWARKKVKNARTSASDKRTGR